MNTKISRDYYFVLFPNEDGCNYPIEFSITDLLESNLDDDYSKEQKLSIIDGLILDIQDYRKKIEEPEKNI